MKETREFTIEGMTCGNCIRHVTNALQAIEGVEIKDVGIGSARIAYDPDQVAEDRVLEAVRQAGYQARLAS